MICKILYKPVKGFRKYQEQMQIPTYLKRSKDELTGLIHLSYSFQMLKEPEFVLVHAAIKDG